ncbi:MAG: PaaI family thioesterase [Hyphomonas sp.]|nr:PaaI family thioesterase [Hyphomonas sp.]
MTSKMTAEEANTFLKGAFDTNAARSEVTLMEEGRAVMRLVADTSHLRPGGYISGPTQMSLVDSAAYMAVMTKTGHEPMTVTSNLSINFLRPCIGDVVVADARILKIGQALAVMEVDVRIEGAEKPSSHAVVTYAIPREPSGMA